MAKAKYDWLKIRGEYVDSPEGIVMEDLAKKYGISCRVLYNKAEKGHWKFDRASFLRLAHDEATEKKADAVSTFAAEWNGINADTAKRLNIKALAEMDAGGKVRDVAGALQIAQNIGMAAAGEAPEDMLLAILAPLQKRYVKP